MASSSQSAHPTSAYSLLNARALLFCKSFITGESPSDMLSKHFAAQQPPVIDEHCSLPPTSSSMYHRYSTTLPFLARSPFVGHDGCLEYFNLLAAVLKVDFPSPIPKSGNGGETAGKFSDKRTFKDCGVPLEPFQIEAVDTTKSTVSVRGRGRFTSVKTGRAWDEEFVYLLTMTEEDLSVEKLGGGLADAKLEDEMPGQWEEKGDGVVEKVKKEEELKMIEVQRKQREEGFEGVDKTKIVKWEIWADPLAAFWATGDAEDAEDAEGGREEEGTGEEGRKELVFGP